MHAAELCFSPLRAIENNVPPIPEAWQRQMFIEVPGAWFRPCRFSK